MFSSEQKLDQQIIEIVGASTAENLSIEFVRDKFRFEMRSFFRSTPRHRIGFEAILNRWILHLHQYRISVFYDA